ncbi:MAG: sigma-70 family RNA polymerase sigma factor [Phycisphaeraceae bacterium]|nr:MAG: sigma-70 family RNA polymerase sigma factor [Phycisphaeraceae bacterium]
MTEPDAWDDELYEALRAIASVQMRRESSAHTLQATAVVHEAYLRLSGDGQGRWNDRQHFLAVAATTIRRVLVDHARAQGALKRGGRGRPLAVVADFVLSDERTVDVLEVHDALSRLALEDEACAQIVELRYFAGLTVDEAAEVLGISRSTALRRWRVARAWLRAEFADDRSGGGSDDGQEPEPA